MGNACTQADIQRFFENLRYMGQLLVYDRDVSQEMIEFQLELDILDPDPSTGFWNAEKAMRFVSNSSNNY